MSEGNGQVSHEMLVRAMAEALVRPDVAATLARAAHKVRMVDSKLLTPAEVGVMLGVAECTVYRMASAGLLPKPRTIRTSRDARPRMRFRSADMRRFVQEER